MSVNESAVASSAHDKALATLKRPVLLTFSGNICSGKRTFTEIVKKSLFVNVDGRELGFNSEDESLPENLEGYYKEKRIFEEKEKQGFKIPRPLIYETQVAFLERKKEQLLKIKDVLNKGDCFVQNRSIYEHAEIFAANWYERGAIHAKKWGDFIMTYRSIVPKFIAPNLIVYLRSSPKTCMKRLDERKMPGEEEIDIKYLEKLHLRYEQMFNNLSYCPVLKVDNDNGIEQNHTTNVLKEIAKKLEELYG